MPSIQRLFGLAKQVTLLRAIGVFFGILRIVHCVPRSQQGATGQCGDPHDENSRDSMDKTSHLPFGQPGS